MIIFKNIINDHYTLMSASDFSRSWAVLPLRAIIKTIIATTINSVTNII